MNRRLILLDYQRLCVWNTGATNIKTAREIIKKSLPSKKTALSIRRILQWNGNTRIDFWTPRSDSSLLINHIITSNPSWRAKEYVPFRLRRPNALPRPRKHQQEFFKILTLNTQGVGKKRNSLTQYIEESAVDFAIIQETNLKEDKAYFMTANYNSVHRASIDLTESARGLMIMYRRDLYTVTILDVESSVRNWILPIIAKNIYNGKQHLIVGVYLNASRQVRTKHFPLFVRTIKKLRKENGETEITVAGDFNINPQELDSELTTYHQLGLQRLGEWNGSEYTWRRIQNGRFTSGSHIDHILSEPRETIPTISIDENYGHSDHCPVLAKWELPPPPQPSKPVTRMNHKLILAKADEIRRSNYFAPLLQFIQDDDPEQLAEELTKTCWKAAEENHCTSTTIPGRPRKKKKMLISNQSKRLIKARKEALENHRQLQSIESLEKVRDICSQTEKSLKNDKKTRNINWQTKLSDAIATGEASDEAWKTINSCIGRARTRTSIKSLENIATGELATTEETIGEALFQHYKHLFSDNENFNSIDWDAIPIHHEESTLPYINDPIEWPELYRCIRKLGRGKSPGPDGVVSELYITATQSNDPKLKEKVKTEPICDLGKTLLGLTKLIWRTGKFPRCWDAAVIVSLPKKPGSSKPGDYRGISLIPTISKLVTSILATRILKGALETNRICPEQAGFRSYEEAVAQATLVYELTEKARLKHQLSYITFIDAEKAFDRAPHGAIVAKSRAFGIRGQALELIKNLYQHASFTVRNGSWTSEPGKVEKGVKQGDPLSPILFCIFMNDLNKAIQANAPTPGHSLYNGGPQITAGKFADDVAMIAPNRETAMHQQTAASEWMDTWKMKANAAKCATMIIEPIYPGYTPIDVNPEDWKMQNQPIPIKHEYTYLGIHLNSNLGLHQIAQFRLEKAISVKNMCLKFFWSRTIPLHLKTTILKAIIIPVCTYGCEVWGWNSQANKDADKIIIECIRNIITGSKSSNHHLLRICLDIEPIAATATKKSIRLFKKSTISKTHFKDITKDLDPEEHSWAKKTIEEILKLIVPVNLTPELEFEKSPLVLDPENDKIFMTLIKNQLRRHYIKNSLQEKPNELESIQRFRKGQSVKWNQLYLYAWKLHPTISKGFTVLLKIRITDYRGTYRLAREGKGLQEWNKTCPFCNLSEHPEYPEHIIIICQKWKDIRQEIFGTTLMSDFEMIALTILTLGQPTETSVPRFAPKVNFEENPTFMQTLTNNIQKFQKIATQPEENPTLFDWIIKTATFLDRIHFKRRKLIENLMAPPKTRPQQGQRQTRITDYMS